MKPTIAEALALKNIVYARHCAGCCAHIVTDDGNTERAHVVWCLKQAHEQGHKDCIALLETLLLMSKTQRDKVFKDSSCYHQKEGGRS